MHRYSAIEGSPVGDTRSADGRLPVTQQIERWLAEQHNSLHHRQRPWVTLAYAQGWDGSITTRAGESLSLSSNDATCLTHYLRSCHDGILVGIGTVLADDPQLTVRYGKGENPQPIVLDTHLRTPATARLCQHVDKRCWILTCQRPVHYSGQYAEIITLDSDDQGDVNLAQALAVLWQKGIRTLMVEGGSAVITAFLRAQLADAIVLTIAPLLVGGYKGVGELGLTEKYQLPNIQPIFTGHLGNDVIMWGNLHYSCVEGASTSIDFPACNPAQSPLCYPI